MNQFVKENDDLSRALEDFIEYYRGEGRERLFSFRALASGSRGLDFCGMGTSEFTPHAVEWRLAALGYSSRIMDAGEFTHYGEPWQSRGRLLVFTSQSGESAELKSLFRYADSDLDYVAVTNSESNTLARGSTLTLPLCAGHEQSITTKTFTNNLALLHLLTTVLEKPDRLDGALSELEATAEALSVVDADAVVRATEVLSPADAIAFVGRGPSIVNAKQCALTFMEGARCVAAAFTGGGLNHGPFEAVGRDFRMVVFAPAGRTESLIDNLLKRAGRQETRIVAFTDRVCPTVGSHDTIVAVPIERVLDEGNEDLFPIVAARSHNLLLHAFAASRGVEAGEFRYGSKVTADE